jgi:putative membrane protein
MKFFKAQWIIVLLFSALGSSFSYAVTLNAFVEEAAQQSLFQTDSAKIAMQKSQMAEVKDFASQMTSKNTELYSKIKALGTQLQMDVPVEPSVAGKAKIMRLESRDESFDRIYIDSQAEALEQKVYLFKKEAMSSENPQLKAFAKAALADILKQEQAAKALQNRLKPSAGALIPAKP